jgi:hypothetical protein
MGLSVDCKNTVRTLSPNSIQVEASDSQLRSMPHLIFWVGVTPELPLSGSVQEMPSICDRSGSPGVLSQIAGLLISGTTSPCLRRNEG